MTSYVTHKTKEILKKQQHERAQRANDFIIKHVPRFHQLIMAIFPNTKAKFNYNIGEFPDYPERLVLLRGNKVIAKNF